MGSRRTLSILATTALTVTALAAPAVAAVPAFTKCKGTGEGYEKIGGRPTYTYCGPARAQLSVAGQSYVVKGGLCKYDKKNDYWLFKAGKIETGQAPPTLTSLSITVIHPASPKVPSPDGIPFTGRVSLSFTVPGTVSGLSTPGLVFNNSGRTGEFSGQTMDGRPVNGTFSCR